jgi:hypothetical protein
LKALLEPAGGQLGHVRVGRVPSGTWKVGSIALPSFSSSVHCSAMRMVLCTASGTSWK